MWIWSCLIIVPRILCYKISSRQKVFQTKNGIFLRLNIQNINKLLGLFINIFFAIWSYWHTCSFESFSNLFCYLKNSRIFLKCLIWDYFLFHNTYKKVYPTLTRGSWLSLFSCNCNIMYTKSAINQPIK